MRRCRPLPGADNVSGARSVYQPPPVGKTTTRRDRETRPPDLVDRKFTADKPNRLWVPGIAFVPTASGFLYLAVVLDAWSRKT